MAFPISQLLDPAEFAGRWQRARVSALRAFIQTTNPAEETQSVAMVSEGDREALLRAVFENSKRLGESARWHFGAEWEVSDFHEVLSQRGTPCFTGKWSSTDGGVVLDRCGCDAVKSGGAFLCDYFKEAAEGLVLGLSDEVLYVRHESCGNGSSFCRDLFLPATEKQMAFAPVPEELTSALHVINSELSDAGVQVELSGIAEGTLFYKWQVQGAQSCEDRSDLVQQTIRTALGEERAQLRIRDISPRAIFGPGPDPGKSGSSESQEGKRKWNTIVA